MNQPNFKRLHPESGKPEILCPNCVRFTLVSHPNCEHCLDTLEPYEPEAFAAARIDKLKRMGDEANGACRKTVSLLERVRDAAPPQKDFWNDHFKSHLEWFDGVLSDARFLNERTLRKDWAEITELRVVSSFPMSRDGAKKFAEYATETIKDPELRLASISENSPFEFHRSLAKLLLIRQTAYDVRSLVHPLMDAHLLKSPVGPSGFAAAELRLDEPMVCEMVLGLFHWSSHLKPSPSERPLVSKIDREVLGRKLSSWRPDRSGLEPWKTLGLRLCGLSVSEKRIDELKAASAHDVDLAVSHRIANGEGPGLNAEDFISQKRWAGLTSLDPDSARVERIFRSCSMDDLEALVDRFDFASRPEFMHVVVDRVHEANDSARLSRMARSIGTWISWMPDEAIDRLCVHAARKRVIPIVSECLGFGSFQPLPSTWTELQAIFKTDPELHARAIRNHRSYQNKPPFDAATLLGPGASEELRSAALSYLHSHLAGDQEFIDALWLWLGSNANSVSEKEAESLSRVFHHFKDLSPTWTPENVTAFSRFLRIQPFLDSPAFTDWIQSLTTRPGAEWDVFAKDRSTYTSLVSALFDCVLGERASTRTEIVAKLLTLLPFDEVVFAPHLANLEAKEARSENFDLRFWLTRLKERYPGFAEKDQLSLARQAEAQKLELQKEKLAKRQEAFDRRMKAQLAMVELTTWYQSELAKIQAAADPIEVKMEKMRLLQQEYQTSLAEIQKSAS